MADRRGLFGGVIEAGDGRCVERVNPDIARHLVVAAGSTPVARTAPEDHLAGIVPVTGDPDAGSLTLGSGLDGAAALPVAGASRGEGVQRSLADAAHALGALHGRGVVHGALWPEWIWRGVDGRTLLLTPAAAVDAPALLAVALRVGALAPSGIAFAAPEVLAGAPATAASDVYGMAAVACQALTGELPVGQFDRARTFGELPSAAAYTLALGLHHTPQARPTMDALAAALEAIAVTPPQPARTVKTAAPAAGGNELSAILVLVLAVGGFFVLTGAIWLVAIGWDQLGEVGRVALLLALTAGVWGAGEWSLGARYTRSGLALVTLATQLLWADGAYVLHQQHRDGAGSWSVVSVLVASATLAYALRLRAPVLGLAATVDLAIAAGCLGEYLRTGTFYGPAVYSACVGGAYALLTAVAEVRAARAVGAQLALAGSLALALSAVLGLHVLDEGAHPTFGTLWPYLVTALLAAPVFVRTRAPYQGIAAAVALFLVVIVPTAESVSQHQSLPYLFTAVALGAATAAAGILAPPFARDPVSELLLCLAGAVGLTASPGLLALGHLGGPDETRSMAIAVSVGVVTTVLAFGLSERAQRKESYRLLEAAGLCLFFGVLTVGSLSRLSSYTYPGALLAGGALVLALGVGGRRATLVAFASVALVLNLWIQYFGKLKDYFPVSLLLVGFGLALLAGGLAFEKRVKPLLPKLKDWA